MIIWGSKGRKIIGKTGHFFCPACKADQPYKPVKWSKYFTLYFIPIFPMETLSEYIHCEGCNGDFNPIVLQHTKEQILRATSPWTCSSCNNLNTPDHNQCLACQKPREQNTAEIGMS